MPPKTQKNNVNEIDLKSKGFTRQADGSWSKGNNPALGALVRPVPEQPPLRAVAKNHVEPKKGPEAVCVRVTIISCRRRLLDAHDNLPYAHKSIVDAVAESLGMDDRDARIKWEYGQVVTSGDTGTIVKMEML